MKKGPLSQLRSAIDPRSRLTKNKYAPSTQLDQLHATGQDCRGMKGRIQRERSTAEVVPAVHTDNGVQTTLASKRQVAPSIDKEGMIYYTHPLNTMSSAKRTTKKANKQRTVTNRSDRATPNRRSSTVHLAVQRLSPSSNRPVRRSG